MHVASLMTQSDECHRRRYTHNGLCSYLLHSFYNTGVKNIVHLDVAPFLTKSKLNSGILIFENLKTIRKQYSEVAVFESRSEVSWEETREETPICEVRA